MYSKLMLKVWLMLIDAIMHYAKQGKCLPWMSGSGKDWVRGMVQYTESKHTGMLDRNGKIGILHVWSDSCRYNHRHGIMIHFWVRETKSVKIELFKNVLDYGIPYKH